MGTAKVDVTQQAGPTLGASEGIPGTGRAPTDVGVRVESANSNMAAAVISLSRSSKSTDIDVPGPTDTDLATDMSRHVVASIPEVEVDDRGVTSTLKISSMSIVSGVSKVPKSSG